MLAKVTDTSSKTDKQGENLTEISSKFSAYENCLDKLSIAGITKLETIMEEQEEILNMKIDTHIDYLKSEASSSINNIFYPLHLNNSPSSYK